MASYSWELYTKNQWDLVRYRFLLGSKPTGLRLALETRTCYVLPDEKDPKRPYGNVQVFGLECLMEMYVDKKGLEWRSLRLRSGTESVESTREENARIEIVKKQLLQLGLTGNELWNAKRNGVSTKQDSFFRDELSRICLVLGYVAKTEQDKPYEPTKEWYFTSEEKAKAERELDKKATAAAAKLQPQKTSGSHDESKVPSIGVPNIKIVVPGEVTNVPPSSK